jgi:hypothetical protein
METGTTPTRGLIFTPDTEPNNRLKVARLARETARKKGVASAKVGTLQYTYEVGSTWVRKREDIVEVVYHEAQVKAAQARVNVPIAITRAYYDKSEGIIAAEFVTSNDPQQGPREIWLASWKPLFFIDTTDVMLEGEPWDAGDIKELISEFMPYDMDQLGRAERAHTEQLAAKALRQEHETKVQAAYENKIDEHYWRAHRVFGERATLDLDDKQARIDHRKRVENVMDELHAAYSDELLAICQKNLGKLRCESAIGRDGDGDPYGFITIGEVAIYVLTRWPDENPFGINKDIRRVIAEEFVRQYLR